MGKKVACEFEDCSERIVVDEFDESIWLPVFKVTREHVGYFCPAHVRELRQGLLTERYLLTFSGKDELIIDREPMPKAED